MNNSILLSIWTVYARPKDYPNNYVARRFAGSIATNDVIIEHNLEGIRKHMRARGLVMLSPMPGDDPVIVETWI